MTSQLFNWALASQKALEIQDGLRERGLKANLEKLTYEAGFMLVYGITPTHELYDDKQGIFALNLQDKLGQSIRVVGRNWKRFLVHDWEIFTDIYVMVYSDKQTEGEVLGWTTKDQIQQAPVEKATGKSKMMYVTRNALFDMSDELVFVSSCAHDGVGLWSYEESGWECFLCGRIHYDSRTMKLVEKDELSRRRDPAPKNTEGVERESTKLTMRAERELRRKDREWRNGTESQGLF